MPARPSHVRCQVTTAPQPLLTYGMTTVDPLTKQVLLLQATLLPRYGLLDIGRTFVTIMTHLYDSKHCSGTAGESAVFRKQQNWDSFIT